MCLVGTKESLLATIPELPVQRVQRYVDELHIDAGKAGILVKRKELGDIFDAVIEKVSDKNTVRLTVNYLTSDVMQYVEEYGDVLFERVTADTAADIIRMLVDGELSSRGAKDVIAVLVKEGGLPREIAKRENLFQESDEGALREVVKKILQEHAEVVDEYRAGKQQALQFLVGQVMKETKGSANPGKAQELLKTTIAEKV